jgi:hypothetical protein
MKYKTIGFEIREHRNINHFYFAGKIVESQPSEFIIKTYFLVLADENGTTLPIEVSEDYFNLIHGFDAKQKDLII